MKVTEHLGLAEEEAKAWAAHLKRAFGIHIFICKFSRALWESDGAFQDKDAAKPTLADTICSDLATDLSLLCMLTLLTNH